MIQQADQSNLQAQFNGAQAVGHAYSVDLAGTKLNKPVQLEVGFDPKLLPLDTPKSAVFLAYFDTDKHAWIPAGGQVDEQRNVVTIQTDHLSIWAPWTWNWDTWIAALKGALSGDVSDFVKGVATLTESCVESAQTTAVNNANGNSVIQGCITQDDPLHPQLRVINLKSFYVGISSIPSGPPNPEPGILKPGDPVRFTIDSTATPPLTVRAGFDDASMRWFVVSLVMRLLSAAAPLGDLKNPDINKAALAFIAVGITDVWDGKEITDALVAGNGPAAATKLVQTITQSKFVDRFVKLTIQFGIEHNLPKLTKVTTKGVNKFLYAVASVDVIVTTTDFIANYFFDHESKVIFQWVRPRPATITVAKPQYYPGETISVCYTVPGPGAITITDYSSDGGSGQLLSGDDDGTGHCISATAQGPASTERVVLDYMAGGRKASVETKYDVVNRPPPITAPQPQPQGSGDLVSAIRTYIEGKGRSYAGLCATTTTDDIGKRYCYRIDKPQANDAEVLIGVVGSEGTTVIFSRGDAGWIPIKECMHAYGPIPDTC